MPYYNQPTWGDVIGQIGNLAGTYLSIRNQKKVDEFLGKFKGDQEAWRQDALKDPESESYKYYKRNFGDPNIPTPKSNEQLQDENLEKYINSVEDPEAQRTLRIIQGMRRSGITSPDIVGPIIKVFQKPIQKNDSMDIAQRRDKYMELYPNATPQQWAEMAQADVRGTNPYTSVYTQKPVPQNMPFSAMSPPLYDVQAVESTPAEVMGNLGQTKQQIKQEDIVAKRKLDQEKFDNLKENQKRLGEQFTKVQNAINARFKESQKYKLTPEQRIQFNTTLSNLSRKNATLYKQKGEADKEMAELEAELARVTGSKSMVKGMGGEYEAAIDAQITDLNTRLEAARTKQSDLQMAVDEIESSIPTYGNVSNPSPTGDGGKGQPNDFLRVKPK